jgi:hypothetical protein
MGRVIRSSHSFLLEFTRDSLLVFPVPNLPLVHADTLKQDETHPPRPTRLHSAHLRQTEIHMGLGLLNVSEKKCSS